MNSILKYLVVVVVGIATLVCFDSCQKVEGCTDETAENYNPDAEVSDNSCTYARDKFIGTFKGTLDCQAPLPSGEEFTMVVSESLSSNSEVLLNFEDLANPLPELSARAEGNKLIIDPKQVSVALDPSNPTVLTDLEYSGEATIAGDNLSGQILVKIILLGSSLPCNMTATKQ